MSWPTLPSRPRDLLAQVLSRPQQLPKLSLDDWDRLIPLARNSDLLARLYHLCDEHHVLSRIPEAPRVHLSAAVVVTNRHRALVAFEAECIWQSLSSLDIPVVLLKGAAYSLADLPPAAGRLFMDIDILVPKVALASVERQLERHGWLSSHHGDYDDRYYRQWMHELPPLKHGQRQTLLDVHHAILPVTARLKPSSDKLLSARVPIAGYPGLFHLSREDLVLHSATHLFHDGEFEHGLRDLVDLDSLLRHFSVASGFWSRLVERAQILDLQRPLYYALFHSEQQLLTPVPKAVLSQARAKAGLSAAGVRLMGWLFRQGLRPDHPSCYSVATWLARWLLYLRAHYLRMPMRLLLPHLVYKAFVAPYLQWQLEKQSSDRISLDDFLAQKKMVRKPMRK